MSVCTLDIQTCTYIQILWKLSHLTYSCLQTPYHCRDFHFLLRCHPPLICSKKFLQKSAKLTLNELKQFIVYKSFLLQSKQDYYGFRQRFRFRNIQTHQKRIIYPKIIQCSIKVQFCRLAIASKGYSITLIPLIIFISVIFLSLSLPN